DGDVRRQERAPGLTDEVERPLGILPEVVEEDAADAAGLLAVREVEVLVAPRLEAAVVGHAGVAVADGLPDAVEALGVLSEGVDGREVGATAKPLVDRREGVLAEAEVPEAGVDR